VVATDRILPPSIPGPRRDRPMRRHDLAAALEEMARGGYPFVGIPAFVYRKFRHSCAYINVAAGIDKPEDLKGKRVGIPEWQMTATVWLRGFLQDDYGVRPSDIHWLTGFGVWSERRKWH
jgi:hypothetical protein